MNWFMIYLYLCSRQQYLNFFYGCRFCDWVVECALRILADPGATETAKSAADAIIALTIDIRLLVKSSRWSAEEVDSSWIEEKCGAHTRDLREAFDCLVIMAVLADRKLGTALRHLIGEFDEPQKATTIRRLLGQAAYKRSVRASALNFGDIVATVARLPVSRLFTARILGQASAALKAA